MSKRPHEVVEGDERPACLNVPGTKVPDVLFLANMILSGHVQKNRISATAVSVLAYRVNGRVGETYNKFVVRCKNLWNSAPLTHVRNGELVPMVEHLWLASKFRKGLDPFNITIAKRRQLGTYSRKTHAAYLRFAKDDAMSRCHSVYHGTRTGLVDHLNGTFLPTCTECKRDADNGVLMAGHASFQLISACAPCVAHVNLGAYLTPEVALALLCLQQASARKGIAFACDIPVAQLHFFGSVVRANAHAFDLRFGPSTFALTTFGTAVNTHTKAFPVKVSHDIARILRTASVNGAVVLTKDVNVAKFPAIVRRGTSHGKDPTVPAVFLLITQNDEKILIDLAYAQLIAMLKGSPYGMDEGSFQHHFRVVVSERYVGELDQMTTSFVDKRGCTSFEQCDAPQCTRVRYHVTTNMCVDHAQMCIHPHCGKKALSGDMCGFHAGTFWFAVKVYNVHQMDARMLAAVIAKHMRRIKAEKAKRVHAEAMQLKKRLRVSDRDFEPVLKHIEAHRMAQKSQVTWTFYGNPVASVNIAPVIKARVAPIDGVLSVHISDGKFLSVMPMLVAAANEVSVQWNGNITFVDELDVYASENGVAVKLFKEATKTDPTMELAETMSVAFDEYMGNKTAKRSSLSATHGVFTMFD